MPKDGKDNRQHPRAATLMDSVRTRVQLADGTILKGMIADISPGGAQIVGDTAGLILGDEVDLSLLFPLNARITYRCRVRHIGPGGKYWGAEFTGNVTLLPFQHAKD